MKKEIRQEIREYILSQVNMKLARLGVDRDATETREFEDKYNGTIHYEFETAAIHQQPMMFKKTYVDGYMVSIEIKKEDDRFFQMYQQYDVVVVNLYWRWESFRGGSNGTELGRIVYAVERDLPEKFGGFGGEDGRKYYVREIEGMTI